MKIDNINVHFITNVNSTVRKLPADKIKFYACYRVLEDGTTRYIGTFDKGQLWITLKRRYPNEPVKIKAYARQTDAKRGRDGRWQVTICYSFDKNDVRRYKYKKDAIHKAKHYLIYGYVDYTEVIDTETGEVIYGGC